MNHIMRSGTFVLDSSSLAGMCLYSVRHVHSRLAMFSSACLLVYKHYVHANRYLTAVTDRACTNSALCKTAANAAVHWQPGMMAVLCLHCRAALPFQTTRIYP